MRDMPTLDEVLEIHKYLIDEFGGPHGIRDLASLESALGRLTTGYYTSIEEEAGALMESLSQNHPFVDGNKRVSFFVTDVFLRMNGYYLDCESEAAFGFFDSLFEAGDFDNNHLVPWVKDHMKKL